MICFFFFSFFKLGIQEIEVITFVFGFFFFFLVLFVVEGSRGACFVVYGWKEASDFCL